MISLGIPAVLLQKKKMIFIYIYLFPLLLSGRTVRQEVFLVLRKFNLRNDFSLI